MSASLRAAICSIAFQSVISLKHGSTHSALSQHAHIKRMSILLLERRVVLIHTASFLCAAALSRVNTVNKDGDNTSWALVINKLIAAPIKTEINLRRPCKGVSTKIKIKFRAPPLQSHGETEITKGRCHRACDTLKLEINKTLVWASWFIAMGISSFLYPQEGNTIISNACRTGSTSQWACIIITAWNCKWRVRNIPVRQRPCGAENHHRACMAKALKGLSSHA